MKVLPISMPDVVPIIINETAVQIPNHGFACVGGNIDAELKNFCSMKHMYGRTFRTYPVSRVLADLDDIYYKGVLNIRFFNQIKDCEKIFRRHMLNIPRIQF